MPTIEFGNGNKPSFDDIRQILIQTSKSLNGDLEVVDPAPRIRTNPRVWAQAYIGGWLMQSSDNKVNLGYEVEDVGNIFRNLRKSIEDERNSRGQSLALALNGRAGININQAISILYVSEAIIYSHMDGFDQFI